MNIKTMSKIIAMAVLAVIYIAFAGCTVQITPTPPATTTTPIETTTPETTAPVETTVPETTAPIETTVPETTAPVETMDPTTESALSGNWADMQFMLDGTMLHLPMTVQDLEAAGWTVDLEIEDLREDYTLDAHTKLVHAFTATHSNYPGNFLNAPTFYFYLWNSTGEALPLEQCEIFKIEIDVLYPMNKGNAYPELVLGNGLTFGDSLEKVQSLCGTATHSYESDSLGYTELTYDVNDEEIPLRFYTLRVTVYENIGITKIYLSIN